MKAICVGILIFSSTISLLSQWTSHLPIISIDTKGKEIGKNDKVEGELKIFWVNDTLNSTDDDPFLKIDKGIEYRGRSSQRYPKKGMGIRLKGNLGQDTMVSIFNMPKAADWILHNPYGDKSLIRNALAYGLSEDIMVYAPKTYFAELEVNGEYYGVGLWTEKIEARAGRVPINKVGSQAESGNAVTGGYVLKIDKGQRSERLWTSSIPSSNDDDEYTSILAHDPPKNEMNKAQQDYLEQYLENFDDAMNGEDFNDPDFGYPSFVDMTSLVDYMIISEVSRNVDAYRISTYFYKPNDVNGGRLHFGPVWDYNIAFGNANYCEGYDHRGWAWDFNYVCEDDNNNVHFWWEKWAQDSLFQQHFRTRWQTLRMGTLADQEVLMRIDSLVENLGSAIERNFDRWPVLGKYVWPNDFVGTNYQEEIDYLKTWIIKRMAWMDEAINDEYFSRGTLRGFESITLRPNPTIGTAEIHFVSRHPGPRVTIDILNSTGQLIETLPRIEPEFNEGSVSWDPPGPGLYFLRFKISQRILETRKLLVH